jgi:hypothetical protein
MVKVCTSRLIEQDRVADANRDQVNTTTQSGKSGQGAILSPSWSLVMGHKLHMALAKGDHAEIARWQYDKINNKPITPLNDAQYTDGYLALLRERYAKDKRPFLDLLGRDTLTLTCYCAPGTFCHRHIAVDVLERVATFHNMPFERGGEIDPYTGRLWLAHDDPARQRVQIGVVDVLSPDDKKRVGYATAALLTSNGTRKLLEMAHFAPNERDRAEKYADDLIRDIERAKLVMSGSAEDVHGTTSWIVEQTRDYGLSGLWKPFSAEQNAAWERGERTILRAAHTLQAHPDPERNCIRFGVLPILSPNNGSRYGYAAAAMLEQGDKRALIELAHFPLDGEKRAHEFVANVENTLDRKGYKMEGDTKRVEHTVAWLGEHAQHNYLSGEWSALSVDEYHQLQEGKYALSRTYGQVSTLSNGRGAEWANIE